MKTKIIYFIISFLVIVGVLVLMVRYNPDAPAPDLSDEKNELEKIKIDPSVTGITLPLSKDPKDLAWALFQKYLDYNKTRNLEGVKSVVYKIAPVCADPKTRIDCEARMGAAYSYGSALKKEDFVNVWTDEKQTILATEFNVTKNNESIGRSRGIIFFIKDEKGDLKMLSFSPFKGVVASIGSAPEQEINDRLLIYTEDKDEDGIADYDEECLAAKEGVTCTKTNPKERDTNQDGWWDGIEALF